MLGTTDMGYEPNSTDAMFSRIETELKNLNAAFDRSLSETRAVGDRVSNLEKEKWFQRGIVAAISVAVTTGWEWWKSNK